MNTNLITRTSFDVCLLAFAVARSLCHTLELFLVSPVLRQDRGRSSKRPYASGSSGMPGTASVVGHSGGVSYGTASGIGGGGAGGPGMVMNERRPPPRHWPADDRTGGRGPRGPRDGSGNDYRERPKYGHDHEQPRYARYTSHPYSRPGQR